jgi:hypothetical protein
MSGAAQDQPINERQAMTGNPESLVLSAAREYANAVVALENGERYSVTRINRATAALLAAARNLPENINPSTKGKS